MTIHITPEFNQAFDTIREGRNVLITGKAGTGKSTLLRQYLEKQSTRKKLIVAPTGVAALNVGGFTIHRAFGFRPGLFPEDISPDGKWHLRNDLRLVLKAIDVLIIDEISMVRADIFDMMDRALRLIRGNTKPFGGIQLILVGDLLQLPPVVTDDEQEFFNERWTSPYFYSAHCYRDINIIDITLTKVWRQSDNSFIEVLNQIREGSFGDQTADLLNGCVDKNFVPSGDWVTLTSRRKRVEDINTNRLQQLNSPIFSSQAEFIGEAQESSHFSGATQLQYARGARVMTVINDPQDRFVNGSFGEIVQADEETISVQLDDGGQIVQLHRHTWEIKQPRIADGTLISETVGEICQFPVILAWAITIHKSQGKTLPKCFIDLSGGTATDGQLYVALSRAVDLENLRLSSPIESRHVRANNALVRRTRRELRPLEKTTRVTFISVDGVHFGVSDHIARIYCQIIDGDKTVAEFGSWINPMADLGDFGRSNRIPPGGLAMAPTLADFWPLLLRQAAGSLVVGDRLAMLERAVRHQEKGMNLNLGAGYDISELDYSPDGTDVIARCHRMVNAYQEGVIAPTKGVVVPEAPANSEGAVFIPTWAQPHCMDLDLTRATDSDVAWAAFSGGNAHPANPLEIEECAELLAGWALSRGCWTDREHRDVVKRARKLGLDHIDLPQVEAQVKTVAELLRPGTRVAFTGRDNLLGGPSDDSRLEEICKARNLEYKTSVSKTKCDVLIAKDPASMSRKAQNAREFGKPIIEQVEFERWWNNGPFLSADQSDSSDADCANGVSNPPEGDTKVPENPDSTIAPRLKAVSPADYLSPGTRVSFRGSTFIKGVLIPQGERLQELCLELDLDYKQAVTKSRCDVLVTDSLDASDGKTALAYRYDKIAILSKDFSRWAEGKLSIENPLEQSDSKILTREFDNVQSSTVVIDQNEVLESPDTPPIEQPVNIQPPHHSSSILTTTLEEQPPTSSPVPNKPESSIPTATDQHVGEEAPPSDPTSFDGPTGVAIQDRLSAKAPALSGFILLLVSAIAFIVSIVFMALGLSLGSTVSFVVWLFTAIGASAFFLVAVVRKLRSTHQ